MISKNLIFSTRSDAGSSSTQLIRTKIALGVLVRYSKEMKGVDDDKKIKLAFIKKKKH